MTDADHLVTAFSQDALQSQRSFEVSVRMDCLHRDDRVLCLAKHDGTLDKRG